MKKLLLAIFLIPTVLVQLYAAPSALEEGILTDGDLTSLTISDDADNIIVTVQGTLTTAYSIFIDADNNENTGYADWSWTTGAEYYISAGAIYKHTGLAGAWGFDTWLGAVDQTDPSANERIIKIPKNFISSPSISLGSTILVGYKSISELQEVTDVLPDTPSLQSYTLANSPNLTSIVITEDATNLYITVSGAVFEASYNIYINSDGDINTGLVNTDWTEMGADYLIQQWTGMLQYTGAGGDDFTFGTQVGAAPITVSASQIVIAVPLSLMPGHSNNISVGFSNIVAFATTDKLPSSGAFISHAIDTHIWSGSAWDDEGVPGATDNVRMDGDYSGATLTTADLTVNAGATLTVSSGETLTVNGDLIIEGNIIVASGGSLITYDGNSISGNAITFNRNTSYADGKYSFVGSPIMPHSSITGDDLGLSVFSYNEVTAFDADAGLARWEDASASVLMPGVGYTQAFQQPISFSGTPNSGTITVSGLSHTIPTVGTTAEIQRGWNLISNPYPAAVNVLTFLTDNMNIEGSIYLWNDGGSNNGRRDDSDYEAVNAIVIGGDASKGYIGSSQGFFVQVSAESADASVEFNELQRDAGNNTDATFYRKAGDNQTTIRLALEGDFYNETVLGFRADATLAYDRLFDAKKLVGNENIAFYSMLNDDKYAIQGLPTVTDNISISLGYDLALSGTYNLGIVEASNLPEGYDVFIINLLTDEEYNLSANGDAQLSLIAGKNTGSLEVQLRKSNVLSLGKTLASNLNVFLSENLLNIELTEIDFERANISIYDLSGSKVFYMENQVFEQNKWSAPLSLVDNRVYILSIDNGNKVISRKFAN